MNMNISQLKNIIADLPSENRNMMLGRIEI